MFKETKKRIVTSNSKFVQTITTASNYRRQRAKFEDRDLNSADVCSFDPKQISNIINFAFWASLELEEGRQIRGILTIVCPQESPLSLSFQVPQSLTVKSIVALTTASPTKALAIHTGQQGNPEVWGFSQPDQLDCMCIRITGLGTVLVSLNKSVIAVIHNGELSIPTNQPDRFTWLRMISLNFDNSSEFPDKIEKASILLDIVTAIFKAGHGGALVVLPSHTINIISDIDVKYDLGNSNLISSRLEEFKKSQQEMVINPNIPDDDRLQLAKLKFESIEYYKRIFRECLVEVGNLSSVDGAVIIDENFSLYGFGSKLRVTGESHTKDESVRIIDVLNMNSKRSIKYVKYTDLGGTRHQSAARFVQKHNDVWVFVVSQDGHVTLFTWLISEAQVLGLKNLNHLMWD